MPHMLLERERRTGDRVYVKIKLLIAQNATQSIDIQDMDSIAVIDTHRGAVRYRTMSHSGHNDYMRAKEASMLNQP